MINKYTLLHDFIYLFKNFYKVIEVNKEENTYFEVYVNDEERVVYKDVNYWATEFANNGGVLEEDKENFLSFFFGGKNRVYYKRNINGQWRLVCMERFPMEEPIELLVVRDIEDYVNDFFEQRDFAVFRN